MRKLLFRSRSGEGYPMVIAVTLCLLMLFMVIAEYFRVNIIVQGVRDAVQQAVIATVNENYDDVYHSVREGYAAGWFPEGDGEWFESVDTGDVYGNLSYILGLTTDGDGYMKYAGNELSIRSPTCPFTSPTTPSPQAGARGISQPPPSIWRSPPALPDVCCRP